MKRVVFAFALAAITFVIAYGTSNAAAIAPLPEGVATSSSNIVKAYYWHHHYYHHRHWYHHHWRYW
jgi:hypothetical protein